MKRLALAAATLGVATFAHADSGEQFAVCNLDPNGNNGLALKAGPEITSARIAKFGPGTLLLTWNPDPVGISRQVTVLASRNLPCEFTELDGWVHTGYICRDPG